MDSYNPLVSDGTPDLSEEENQQMLAEQQRMDELYGTPDPIETDTEEEAPEATVEESATPPDGIDPNNPDIEYINGKPFYTLEAQRRGLSENLTRSRQQFKERMSAPGQGYIDTVAVDLLNLIPGVDIPKTTKYEDEVAQSVRELSGIILPTIALGGAAKGAISSAPAVQKSKFLSDPLVKHLGDIGVSAGAGAFVDYVAETNQRDDNAAGALKKTMPRWFGWIPDDIATLDSDSPDVKRAKNVTEGAYLGVGTDVILGLNKLFKAVRGITSATDSKFIPDTEKAKTWFSKNTTVDETAEDVIERSAAKRSDALDEVGGYNLGQQDIELKLEQGESVFGVHDAYGYQELGIRSVDDLGIVGAAVDLARISDNIDTVYGRLGSIVSEGALKYSLDGVQNQEAVIRGLTNVLQDAGEYGYRTATGKYISNEKIVSTGEKLAADLYEMDLPSLKRAVSSLQGEDSAGAVKLNKKGYNAVSKAIQKYMDDFANMDYMRAQAYVGTSFAGQVSDMAQGLRLTEGTVAIERAQEQILDRIEFLMSQKDITKYVGDRVKNMTGIWNRLTKSDLQSFDAKNISKVAAAVTEEQITTLRAMESIKQDARKVVNNLRAIKEEQPEMLTPLMLAYEMTDGDIRTIGRLNQYVRQSTGVLRKAFVDLNPDIPSVVLRGFFSNLYNSTLSAFGTPIKAGLSNAYLLLEKPVRTMAGGLGDAIKGDTSTIRRGWYQYAAMQETVQDAYGYMKQVFKRSGLDPNVIESREGIGLKNQRQIEVLNSFADAKAEKGDYGPQAMMQIVNDMNALADHPWLRFGNRSMQALDGFTQSMIATFEAKGRAYDILTKEGKNPFTAENGEDLIKQVRGDMFDNTGLIKDKVVQTASGEIAMNLDNFANDALSEVIRRIPILKPFMLFTKTPLNELGMALSYSSLGRFVKLRRDFDLPFEQVDINKVEQLLNSRGVDLSSVPDVRAKYNEIRADVKGREAIGNLAVGGAVFLFMDDRITGNGLYDRQKQALRRKTNWQPRSIRLPGGEWISYDGLGPVTNWLALTTDVMDNFDSLAPNDMGELLRKMSFVVGASFTEKTGIAGLEVFFDVLGGNGAEIGKWSSSFLTSAAVPGSSQMAEISRLMDPALREVEQNAFDYMRNRNIFTKGQLPKTYDWIDGGEVGVPETVLARFWNTYMPWKVNGKISPEKEFLHMIEYDAQPTLRSNGKGIKYTKEQRSEITNIMGRDGLFKKRIQEVMKTKAAKEFRQRYKEAVDAGLEPDLSTFEELHVLLDRELRFATNMAAAKSSFYSEIQREQVKQETVGNLLRTGQQAEAKKFLDYMQGISY